MEFKCPECDKVIPEESETCPLCDADLTPEEVSLEDLMKAELESAETTTTTGPVLPGYTIGDKLEDERWGAVYSAQRARTGEPLELHIIDRTKVPGAALDIIVEQARKLTSIEDVSLVRMTSVGLSEDAAYYCLEPVEGKRLDMILSQRTRLPDKVVARILIRGANALDALAKAGTRHGALRPEEIVLLPSGETKIRHGGIAELFRLAAPRLFENERDASFVSPEELKGEKPTPVSDQYSLGVIGHLCLTGRLPPIAEEIKLEGVFTPLAHAVKKMLSFASEKRYASAAELGAELDQVVHQIPAPTEKIVPKPVKVPTTVIPAKPRPAVQPAPPPPRNPWPFLVTGAVCIGVLAALIYYIGWGGAEIRPPPTPEPDKNGAKAGPSKEERLSQAKAALAALKDRRLPIILIKGDFAEAFAALKEVGEKHPEVAEDLKALRDDALEKAEVGFATTRDRAIAMNRAGNRDAAISYLTNQKIRFDGAGTITRRIDLLIEGLKALAGGTGLPAILTEAQTALEEAGDLYVRTGRSGPTAELKRAAVLTEEAQMKFELVRGMGSPAEGDRIEEDLDRLKDLAQLINDALVRFGVDPTVIHETSKPKPVEVGPPKVDPRDPEALDLLNKALALRQAGRFEEVVTACKELLKEYADTKTIARRRALINMYLDEAKEELRKKFERELAEKILEAEALIAKDRFAEAVSALERLGETYSETETYRNSRAKIEEHIAHCREEIAWSAQARVSDCEDYASWSVKRDDVVRISESDDARTGQASIRIRIRLHDQTAPSDLPAACIGVKPFVPMEASALSFSARAEGNKAVIKAVVVIGEGSAVRWYSAQVTLGPEWEDFKIPFASLTPLYATKEIKASGGPRFVIHEITGVMFGSPPTRTGITFLIDDVRFSK
jgi:serine/threonine protein kinase